MKRYTDFTDEELLTITEEDLSALVDLECAISGVPLLPAAPEYVQEVDVAPDTTVYEVAGFYFEERGAADRVANVINEQRPLQVTCDWQLDRCRHVDGYAGSGAVVKAEQVLTKATHERTRNARMEYKAKKEAYDKLRKEYDRIVSMREECAENVYRAVERARTERSRRELAEGNLQRYIQLADGDEEQARKFFDAAYPDLVVYLPREPVNNESEYEL